VNVAWQEAQTYDIHNETRGSPGSQREG